LPSVGTGNRPPVGGGKRSLTTVKTPPVTSSHSPAGGAAGSSVKLALLGAALVVGIGGGVMLAFKDDIFGPGKPAVPVEPVKPVKSTRPVEPVRVVEPVKPVRPVEPAKPVEPVRPIEPVKPPPVVVDNGPAEKAIAAAKSLLAQLNYAGAREALAGVQTARCSPEVAGAVRTLLRKAEAFDRLTRGIKVRADAGKTISIVTLANDKVLRGVVTKNEDGSCNIVTGTGSGEMTLTLRPAEIRDIKELDPARQRAELKKTLGTQLDRLGAAAPPVEYFNVAAFAVENGLREESLPILERAWAAAEGAGKDLAALVAEEQARGLFQKAHWADSIGQGVYARSYCTKIIENELYRKTSFGAAAEQLLGFMDQSKAKNLKPTYTIKAEPVKPPEEAAPPELVRPASPPPEVRVMEITGKVDLSAANRVFTEGVKFMVEGRPGNPNSNQNLAQAVKKFREALATYQQAAEGDKDNSSLESRILECNRNIFSCNKMMTL
jgi:hypothetical protein